VTSDPGESSEGLAFTVCLFFTAVPITKLFAWGGGGTVEDMC
jgi:hypothetical protein